MSGGCWGAPKREVDWNKKCKKWRRAGEVWNVSRDESAFDCLRLLAILLWLSLKEKGNNGGTGLEQNRAPNSLGALPLVFFLILHPFTFIQSCLIFPIAFPEEF